jgi:glycerate 2-kinase
VKVLVATGGFKEGAPPAEVCTLIAEGLRRADRDVEITELPLADGGTGLVNLLATDHGTQVVSTRVEGPIPSQRVDAYYAMLAKGTCVIESAAAAGLALVPDNERDPRRTSTAGVGELVLDAYRKGARSFLIGCGDSATNDAGVGCLAALGVEFLDEFDHDVPAVGRHLGDIARIELGAQVEEIREACSFEIAANPNSVLCGPDGTTRVYGPQKGAGPEALLQLEEGMDSFVGLLEEHCGRELRFAPAAGGAGGLAGGLHAVFGAKLRFSFDVIRDYVDLDKHLEECDLVVTGEGLLDRRTLSGKLPANVALQAKRFDRPVAMIAGGIADQLSLVYLSGFDAVELSTARPCSMADALANLGEWLPAAAERLLRKIEVGRRMAPMAEAV